MSTGRVFHSLVFFQSYSFFGRSLIKDVFQCCDAVGWVAGRSSGL